MRGRLVAGNWKMHFTVEEGVRTAGELRHSLAAWTSSVDLAVLPPAVMLREVAAELRGSGIQVGAQNAYFEDEGAFTGEISAPMLAGWCRYLLVGHSERRHLFGETDEQVNKKLKAGLKHGLHLILAVGETLAEHDAGAPEAVVERQLGRGLDGVGAGSAGSLTIAYEPVWAIGTGRAATAEYAAGMQSRISEILSRLLGPPGSAVRVLYGGSVSAANAATLMAQPAIHGALVGGASLKPAEFASIVGSAAAAPPIPS